MVCKFAYRFVAPLIVCALPMLANAQVYTWKDANGRTHFSDQPPADIEVKPARGNFVPPQASEVPKTSGSAAASTDTKASGPKSWEEKDREFTKRQQEKAEAEAKAKKEQEAKAQKAQYCSSLRSNLAMLERGGRVATPDAKGEPNYLSESQVKGEADKIRAILAKDCK